MNGQLDAPATYPREKDQNTHWRENKVRPRAGLDVVSKRKIPSK